MTIDKHNWTKLNESNGSSAEVRRVLKEKRLLKTMILIACITMSCYFPSFILLQAFHSDTDGSALRDTS